MMAKSHCGPKVSMFHEGRPLPKSSYEGGKQRRHFTLSEQAFNHLGAIAAHAMLSKSETLERLVRSFAAWEGTILSQDTWPSLIDHSLPSSASSFDD